MSTALCTFIIPSRKRPKRLEESISSIEASAPREAYRIHVRTESDDLTTYSLAHHLLREGRIDLVLDEAPKGYTYIHEAWAALLPVATPWMWIWSDDTLLRGDWVSPLSKQPETGVICHAAIITNNQSTYHWCIGGPFPIIPRNVLDILDMLVFPDPIDTGLDKALRLERGWHTHFLDGVTVQHNRVVDETLDVSRY